MDTDVDLMLIFIKNLTTALVFFRELCEFFQPVTLSKRDPGRSVFLWILERKKVTCIYIKIENPTRLLFCEFFENFLACNFLKIRKSSTCFFSWILKRFTACNLINNKVLAHTFFYEFYKIFKNTYFTEHLRRAA